MCGIVGFTGARSAAPLLLEGLKKLEYRGYDSAGIAVMDGRSISVSKVTGRIANLCEETGNGSKIPGTAGIGHTRWATHGAPTEENAHPHLSNDGRFAIVHNGIIENYQILREELISDGYHFESETDTEVIVHLIEKYYKGSVKEALIKTASRLSGSYALGLICSEEDGKIYAVRESSPLIVGIGTGENFFASDVTALVNETRNMIYLEDGEFAELTRDSIKIFDCMGGEIHKKPSRIMWDVQAAEKGGFEHFMLKEIMEQPGAVKATIAPRIRDGKVFFEELDLSRSDLQSIRKIIITACGSAYHAGCAGRYALEKLCRIPVEVELASELRYSDPLIDDHTLVIVISQSGETADTIAALKECRARGARTISIVNVVGSTIATLADSTVYTWAGPEIAVATTKGYTTQITILYMLAVYFGSLLGYIAGSEVAFTDELQQLPSRIQQAIDLNPSVEQLARKYYKAKALFFIGRNTDYAVALEGALKMKEISYVHSEAYAAGELKHGTIALIEDKQPVITLCCNSAIMEKTLSNIVEVKSRGAEVLALTFRNNQKILSVADDLLFIPDVDAIFSAAIEIVPLQLLAYYVARENGCDIDKPKNLAKSVTVE
ncbi:MAG: glutamine--fructose-6-phosphate transaminase (isomerizing) [Abditibacteriota bacterium]|nr:glutamine--fructose-6-phosphate transaminase (isomerizing) [Abditibacteriota bacterium]